MDLIYPINMVGHDEWLHSGYDPRLSHGDVITRDGEVIGSWRAIDYDPDDEFSGGRVEFTALGEDSVKFAEKFAALDIRMSRGFALSTLTRTIREWYEASNPEISRRCGSKTKASNTCRTRIITESPQGSPWAETY